MDDKLIARAKVLAPVALGALVFGSVCTWILLGAQPGSRPDWIAAAGTWVIGAAACVLARQNNLREERIEREQRSAAMAHRRKSAKRMMALANSCREFALKLDFLGVGKTMPTIGEANGRAQAAYVRCKSADFDLAFVDVEEDGIDLVATLQRNVLALTTLIENFQAQNRDNIPADLSKNSHFKHMVDAAGWVARDSEKLADHLRLTLDTKLVPPAHEN